MESQRHTHTLAAACSYSSIRARSAIYTQTQAKEQQQHHLTPLNSHLWMSTISNVYFEGGKKERKRKREIFLSFFQRA
jgi:hypothetical protein